MNSNPLFQRLEDAILRADKLQDELLALQEQARRLRTHNERIARDLQILTAATHQRQRLAARPLRNFSDHVTAHMQAVAAVHQRLTSGARGIALRDYLPEVCRGLPLTDYDNPEVKLVFDTDPLLLDPDTAVPLGLITTELVMNAYRHGIRAGRAGTIRLAAKGRDSRLARFSVSDTGPGLPANFVRGPGLTIVETLTQGIGGIVEYSSGPHATALLKFADSSSAGDARRSG